MLGLVLALILVPFTLFEESVTRYSEQLMSSTSERRLLVGVVVTLLTADVLLPIPSSFLAAGAVSLLGGWQGGFAIAMGMTAAAWLGYAIGRWGGQPLARRVAGDAELVRAGRMMQRYGAWVLLLCRGVPVLAEASTLLAGTARLSLWQFGLVTALGNVGLAGAYATISILDLSGGLAVLAPFCFGVIVPAGAWWLAHRFVPSPAP